ncbi:MAG: hypothetical protein KDK00_08265 [Rhodobacteraceae bacterium]|nr:hypothetical protein [Paracoccaceae bacterium]
MSDNSGPQFLDIRSYRRKRIVDAAKLLPVIGSIGLVAPVPFFFASIGETGQVVPLALYFFGLWLVLIVLAFVLSRTLLGDPAADE